GPFLRLARDAHTPDSNAYQALSFYFALTVFQFLDGTILKDGVDELWQGFLAKLGPHARGRPADFDRKFFSVPYAMKDYRDHAVAIDRIVRALVMCRVLHIRYAGLWRGAEKPTEHVFEPYTLAIYRGGLYLIGRSRQHRKIVYLAVE